MADNEAVIAALKSVPDPHTGIDIYTMGLIEDLETSGDTVKFTMRPTNPYCPAVIPMAMNAKKAIEAVKGIKKVQIKIVDHQMAEQLNKMLNK
ncbi:MAG: iron-sulfur cluster assembly protein [Candidatus Thermoplasmatota archaeon]|nr:iron-sulfur cluster assembly protein [Candidatus Thermoplasmatota archaeon]